MNITLFKTLKHRTAEIDESLAPLIDKAMDEFAEQEAIAFAEWLYKNGWKRDNYDNYYWNIGPEGTKKDLSIEELYSQFNPLD